VFGGLAGLFRYHVHGGTQNREVRTRNAAAQFQSSLVDGPEPTGLVERRLPTTDTDDAASDSAILERKPNRPANQANAYDSHSVKLHDDLSSQLSAVPNGCRILRESAAAEKRRGLAGIRLVTRIKTCRPESNRTSGFSLTAILSTSGQAEA
jgi:hypothetical protein